MFDTWDQATHMRDRLRELKEHLSWAQVAADNIASFYGDVKECQRNEAKFLKRMGAVKEIMKELNL